MKGGSLMNILMVVSWYSSKDAEVLSAGVFHYEQSMALKKHCNVALYYPYDTELKQNFSKCEEKELLTYRRKMNPMRIPKISAFLHQAKLWCDLKRICKDFKPDILHAHCGLPAGRIVSIFGKIYNIPVVITEHSPLEQMKLDNPKMKQKYYTAYKNSSANICVSTDSMNKLKSNFPNEDFKVIYNGIISPETVEKDNNIYYKDGKINFSIVAAFYSKEIKGYQHLIPAIKVLKQENIPVFLHICGGGDWFDYYKNLAKELDVLDMCQFYGQCDRQKVYTILSQMDFSVSASLFECSGVSVEEALLLGKPMLVTTSGGANSLVTEDNSIVVDKGSTDALVSGIKEMIKRLPNFDNEKIYQYAFNNFEIGQVSKKYCDLYTDLIQRGK